MISDKDKSELKKKTKKLMRFLKSSYPDAKCHLKYDSALQLLIGSILSAQCTDVRVNKVTKALFLKYRTVADFANADIPDLETSIRSTGFYRNKAYSIKRCSSDIIDRYDSKVPSEMDELTTLAGVGRKTANVVRGNFYGKPAIIVDTHIKRVTKRLGLTESNEPDRIESELMELIPEEDRTFFSNSLGDHGRTVCKARKPKCEICGISSICPSSNAAY